MRDAFVTMMPRLLLCLMPLIAAAISRVVYLVFRLFHDLLTSLYAIYAAAYISRMLRMSPYYFIACLL